MTLNLISISGVVFFWTSNYNVVKILTALMYSVFVYFSASRHGNVLYGDRKYHKERIFNCDESGSCLKG
jgi:hypothetical protein